MRRTTLAIAVALSLALVAGAAAASPSGSGSRSSTGAVIDPLLRRQMAVAGSEGMVDAVVVLRSQADLGAIRAGSRRERLAEVEAVLRAEASAGQQSLLAFLRAKRAEGLVADLSPLWIFNGIEVTATPEVIDELATRSDVGEVQANLTITAPEPPAAPTAAPAETNVALVNAPALWDLGYRGQGIVVANMDTGVDLSHPELAARWRGGTNSWFDPNGQHPTTPTDVNGHGTRTMGVMVGGDAGGTSIGMAPDATWIAVKIFNDADVATSTGIHQGFQWLLDPDGNLATADAPHVVDNSWTTSAFGCNLDFQLDLRALRAAGILPVFAAGNFGPSGSTSVSPANNPEAFAVGATDDFDLIYSSSSRGPSACGQPVYPQLTAPGVGVRTTDLSGLYFSATGTSIAAPHVAGGLALLLDAFPGLPVERQEAALESAAVDLGASGADDVYGYGRLDVLAAYDWILSAPDFSVSASPSSATTPPGGTVSFTISVTSVNGFTDDVSLSLSGLSGSEASWDFAPPDVAGGSGTSELTLTADPALTPGTFPLTITGTSGAIERSAFVSLVVSPPPDFTIGASPSSATTARGGAVSFTATIASVNGFADDVALSLTGLPGSVGTYGFVPAVVGGAGTSQLTVPTSATASPGTYPLTVVGTSGPTEHTASISLVVTAAPDFSISVSPSSATVARRGSVSYTVTVSSIGGFAGSVSLSVTGLPSGASARFSPRTVTSPGTSALTVRATRRAAQGTFILTITGTSGILVHQTNATLVVT